MSGFCDPISRFCYVELGLSFHCVVANPHLSGPENLFQTFHIEYSHEDYLTKGCDERGFNPFHHAINSGNPRNLPALLLCFPNANLNKRGGENYRLTPLHLAIKMGQVCALVPISVNRAHFMLFLTL